MDQIFFQKVGEPEPWLRFFSEILWAWAYGSNFNNKYFWAWAMAQKFTTIFLEPWLKVWAQAQGSSVARLKGKLSENTCANTNLHWRNIETFYIVARFECY